jgi:hypothetical protein
MNSSACIVTDLQTFTEPQLPLDLFLDAATAAPISSRNFDNAESDAVTSEENGCQMILYIASEITRWVWAILSSFDVSELVKGTPENVESAPRVITPESFAMSCTFVSYNQWQLLTYAEGIDLVA